MDQYEDLLEKRILERNASRIEQILRDRNLFLANTTDQKVDTIQVYSTAEVCAILKIERHQLYKLIEKDELQGEKLKSWKIPKASVEAYIARIMTKK